ncbi:unnamed protein product, partial [Urochloa humidicola]
EKPKAAKVSRVGTVIRCRKCKQIGHNRSTCERRNGQPSTADSGSVPANFSNTAPPQPSRVVSTTQHSQTAGSSRKRKSTTNATPQSTAAPRNAKKTKAYNSVVRSHAKATVQTTSTGNVEMNLQANVPMSQASSSVTINMTSGKAHAQVTAQEPPRKKLPVRRPNQGQVLLLKGPGEE